MGVALCWFHQDLRLGDNPVLDAAIASGDAVIPLYILDDGAAGDWAMGGASRWWLHHSLTDLSMAFERIGGKLTIQKGNALEILSAMVKETGASAIYTQTRGEPWSKAQLKTLEGQLEGTGCALKTANSAYLTQFGDVLSKSGTRMKVFTPYKRNLLARASGEGMMRPLCPRPSQISMPEKLPKSISIDALDLLPKAPDWSGGMNKAWKVGEAAALQRLDDFLEETAREYHITRDKPSIVGTSRLSPHLHFGEISPVTIYHAVMERGLSEGLEVFLSEVIWREFSYELLDQFPHMPDAPMKAEFGKFPWAEEYEGNLTAWQKGETGYPLIDAGMRELYETGWMHNRVRMITASFLTKHLLVPWQEGAKWFHDTLVDADLASNSAGWQWVAGCGADASPYFRIFNPISQGTKFDAGAYARKWCPELRELDDKTLFAPFELPEMLLAGAGVTLGKNYPKPLVDHKFARERALDAFQQIKS